MALRLALAVEDFLQLGLVSLLGLLGRHRVVVLPFLGHGSPERVHVRARVVLGSRNLPAPGEARPIARSGDAGSAARAASPGTGGAAERVGTPGTGGAAERVGTPGTGGAAARVGTRGAGGAAARSAPAVRRRPVRPHGRGRGGR